MGWLEDLSKTLAAAGARGQGDFAAAERIQNAPALQQLFANMGQEPTNQRIDPSITPQMAAGLREQQGYRSALARMAEVDPYQFGSSAIQANDPAAMLDFRHKALIAENDPMMQQALIDKTRAEANSLKRKSAIQELAAKSFGLDIGGEQPQLQPQSGSVPLGQRQNNWGNIRASGINWQGEVPSDNGFEAFATPEAGLDALKKNLAAYQNKHGINTLEGVAGRWAPPNENNTSSYIENLSKITGIAPDRLIDLTNPQVADAVTKAIVQIEQGKPYDQLVQESQQAPVKVVPVQAPPVQAQPMAQAPTDILSKQEFIQQNPELLFNADGEIDAKGANEAWMKYKKDAQDMVKNQSDMTNTKFTQANTLRDEFVNNSKDFVALNNSLNRVKVGSEANTGAGDIALVYGFMKMLDPTSVVREGEFATAENAGGVPAYVMNLYNKAVSGERLTHEVRKSFVSQAEAQFEPIKAQHEVIKAQYKDMAERAGLNPKDVIPDLTAPEKPKSNEPITIQTPQGAVTIKRVD